MPTAVGDDGVCCAGTVCIAGPGRAILPLGFVARWTCTAA